MLLLKWLIKIIIIIIIIIIIKMINKNDKQMYKSNGTENIQITGVAKQGSIFRSTIWKNSQNKWYGRKVVYKYG